jgi:formylglycine-generating enzyme required for sulfatase activity
VLPSTCLSWFQAEQACALSNKRLVTNQEWQRAAAGTPDDAGSCNIGHSIDHDPNTTGSAPACVSAWGAFDMVGNVWELVGDWQPQATLENDWASGDFADDFSWFGGAGTGRPGEVFRGGYWKMGANAGVFAIDAGHDASEVGPAVGFRCAR